MTRRGRLVTAAASAVMLAGVGCTGPASPSGQASSSGEPSVSVQATDAPEATSTRESERESAPPSDPQVGSAPSLPTPQVTTTVGVDRRFPAPHPYRIRYEDHELALSPHTYCYKVCLDGYARNPPSVGSPKELYVFVPVARFTELEVDQSHLTEGCQERIKAEVEAMGKGWWRVRPRGPAAEYRISLFAHGGGDMIADLIWRTQLDRALPAPSAELELVIDRRGRTSPDTAKLRLENLTELPTDAGATITLTPVKGQPLRFAATGRRNGCGPVSSVSWTGPAGPIKKAKDIGDLPFSVRVELILDGVTHVATARYPTDAKDPSDHVPLRFDPPLA